MPTIDMRNIKKIYNPSNNRTYKKVTTVVNGVETPVWKGTWKYTINIGDYVSSIKYKIDNGNWTTISSNTTLEVDSGKTLYIQALSYNTDDVYWHYTSYNFSNTVTESNNGGSVTIYQTRERIYYTSTIVAGYYVNTVRAYVGSGTWSEAASSVTVSHLYEDTVHYEAVSYDTDNAQWDYSGALSGSFSNSTSTQVAISQTRTLQKYTITWMNYDGTVLETDTNVEYGLTPSYDGSTPTKPQDNTYTYTFNGWSPSVTTVTGNQTYTAQFSSSYRYYSSNVYVGTNCARVRAKVDGGSWSSWDSSSVYLTHTYNQTIYWEAESISDTSQYYYTGSTSGSFSGGDGASYTVSFTQNIQQYVVTISGTRCSANKSSGTYAYGTVITWTANTNCAFNSSGTSTTSTATITGAGTYTKSANYVNCTTSGTNCSANKTGWMSYGETITWTANNEYHFGSSNSTTTTTDSAIAGSLSKTASINNYRIYIYNDSSNYSIYCGSYTIPEDDSIVYGTYAYGTTVTIPSCYPNVSPYTASGTRTVTVTGDVNLRLVVTYQSAGMVDTHAISYFGATYISQSYRGGPGSAIWGNDAGGYNPLPSSEDTHIQLVYSGTTYIAPIPSDVKTMGYYWGSDDSYGPYTANCIVGSGTIAWFIRAYSEDDTDVEVYVTLQNKGSSSNYNKFTSSSCVYGRYVSANYICSWSS